VGAGVAGGPPQEQRERRSFRAEGAAGSKAGTKGAGGTLSDSHTRLSPPVEAALVVSITLGCFVIASTVAVFNPPASPPLSNAHFLELLLLEPALAAVALFVLRANGNLSSYGLTPNWKGAAEGLALAIVTYAVCILTYLAVYPFFPTALQSRGNEMVARDLIFGLVIAISIVNPLFEEFFVSGYLITTLKQWKDPWFAINASVTVRLLYHLYQGPSGIVAIIPLGFVFAQWYIRTGRLWPLVVAHALFDFAGLNGPA
jgi:membrane protease YdiL (CAAX protease family)